LQESDCWKIETGEMMIVFIQSERQLAKFPFSLTSWMSYIFIQQKDPFSFRVYKAEKFWNANEIVKFNKIVEKLMKDEEK